MAHFDTLVRGGLVVNATGSQHCDIAISNGTIIAVGQDLGTADALIEADGLIVVPGGIDSHVHIAQPSGEGIEMADDFASGTLSALCGGTTTVLPFCLQQKGQSLREALKDYHRLAEGNCHTDVSFHLIITDPTQSVLGQELPALAAEGYSSFKVFMTYEGMRLYDDQILAAMDCARDVGALVMVHCENEDAIRFLVDKHEQSARLEPKYHAATRPQVVEREATHRAISLAEVVDVPVVIVHVSNRPAMEEIARAQARGRPVFGETCPQYLMLTAQDLEGMDWEGAKFVCSPPPRDAQSQEACWEGLQDGTFALFSSDHCPFRYADDRGKLNPRGRRNFRWIPNGIPGVETRLPILFSEGVTRGRIGIERFVALSSTNHARLYGLYPRKGVIAPGADADLVLWDPAKVAPITQSRLHHGADYTPYEGLEITGWPVLALLGGQTVMRDGEPVSPTPHGRYLARDRSPQPDPMQARS